MSAVHTPASPCAPPPRTPPLRPGPRPAGLLGGAWAEVAPQRFASRKPGRLCGARSSLAYAPLGGFVIVLPVHPLRLCFSLVLAPSVLVSLWLPHPSGT